MALIAVVFLYRSQDNGAVVQGGNGVTVAIAIDTATNPQGAYPFTSLRKVTYNDIANLTPAMLRIMRNEIYARHGYIFDSKDLQTHFKHQDWYTPISKEVNLSPIEKYNVEFIKSYE